MFANNGDTEGLFRGAFMQSGGPIPVGYITHGQPEYDALVRNTKCDTTDDTGMLKKGPVLCHEGCGRQSPGT